MDRGASHDETPAMSERSADIDVAALAALLHETAEHHDAFEQAAPAHDWWDWYAPYLRARLDARSSDEATEAADGYMQTTYGITRR
jgi:hypothetical protein